MDGSSAANQSLFAFMDQDVSNGGGAGWFQLATRSAIARRQFLEFLPASRGSQQRLQFAFSFLKVFRWSHELRLSFGFLFRGGSWGRVTGKAARTALPSNRDARERRERAGSLPTVFL
jgi:hypothetical protein